MQGYKWFNKYHVLKILGQGGTSQVFLARHIKLDSLRAIKRISKKNYFHSLLLKEAYILKNLKHSCIPIIYDIEEDDSYSYIIQEHITGINLKQFLKKKNALPEKQIINFGIQLCDLIHHLHSHERPILHLDIKPENIIIDKNILKLIDFGNSIYSDEAEHKKVFLGTKGYAAPEMYKKEKIDERTDVYSIGVLLHYMITGEEFSKGNVSMENINLKTICSKKLKTIIMRCLRHHPSNRYSSVSQLHKELSAIYSKENKQSYQPTIISIAGSQRGIGVTHLAFIISNYYQELNIKCLYIEKNKTDCVIKIKNTYERIIATNGIYVLNNLPMMANIKNLSLLEVPLEEYPIKIQDYGCLNEENQDDFMKGDIKVLVLGGKDWEIESSEKALELIKEDDDIYLLFNFLDRERFQELKKSMGNFRTFRIPYEPDPFKKINNSYTIEFLEELTRVHSGTEGFISRIKTFIRN